MGLFGVEKMDAAGAGVLVVAAPDCVEPKRPPPLALLPAADPKLKPPDAGLFAPPNKLLPLPTLPKADVGLVVAEFEPKSEPVGAVLVPAPKRPPPEDAGVEVVDPKRPPDAGAADVFCPKRFPDPAVDEACPKVNVGFSFGWPDILLD